jgi:hypothetical protein
MADSYLRVAQYLVIVRCESLQAVPQQKTQTQRAEEKLVTLELPSFSSTFTPAGSGS